MSRIVIYLFCVVFVSSCVTKNVAEVDFSISPKNAKDLIVKVNLKNKSSEWLQLKGKVSLMLEKDNEVSFLVVGDALCATTHMDLFLRAKQMGTKVEVIHNASIMNAVAACGLQLYRFGETISIPFFHKSWRPYSFYDKLALNLKNGNHTLCLLDIKTKEQSEENLMRGREIYEPPRFMTVNQALEQLFSLEEEHGKKVISDETLVVIDTFDNPVKVDRKQLLNSLTETYTNIMTEWNSEWKGLERKR